MMQSKREEMKFKNEVFDPYVAAWKLKTNTALMADAVLLFASALSDVANFTPKPLFCNSTDNWMLGDSVTNIMSTVSQLCIPYIFLDL